MDRAEGPPVVFTRVADASRAVGTAPVATVADVARQLAALAGVRYGSTRRPPRATPSHRSRRFGRRDAAAGGPAGRRDADRCRVVPGPERPGAAAAPGRPPLDQPAGDLKRGPRPGGIRPTLSALLLNPRRRLS
jgi:hypothetical protein